MSEELCDPLAVANKHMMVRNGLFEFDDVKQGICCCSHSIMDHLDCDSYCLAKTKEICICERYLEKGSKMITPQKQGKLPKKEEEQIDVIIEEGKISKARNDQERFMRQYGIT
jgi:hypothetical protein